MASSKKKRPIESKAAQDGEVADTGAPSTDASNAKANATDATRSGASGSATKSTRTITLKVRRQDALEKPRSKRWETFTVQSWPRMTLADALLELEAEASAEPVAFEAECLEGVCGACTVLAQGRVTLACTALLDELAGPKNKPVRVEPLDKASLVQDLIVSRTSSYAAAAQLGVTASATLDSEPIERAPVEPSMQIMQAELTRCIDCGACYEACPEAHPSRDFVGPAVLNLVEASLHRQSDASEKAQRLDAVMSPGGIGDCGKSENCVEVCPMGIPMVDSLQQLSRATTKRMLLGWLLK